MLQTTSIYNIYFKPVIEAMGFEDTFNVLGQSYNLIQFSIFNVLHHQRFMPLI